MRFIPTFALEKWMYRPETINMFIVKMFDGNLYGKDLPVAGEKTGVYRYEPETNTWVKMSRGGIV